MEFVEFIGFVGFFDFVELDVWYVVSLRQPIYEPLAILIHSLVYHLINLPLLPLSDTPNTYFPPFFDGLINNPVFVFIQMK